MKTNLQIVTEHYAASARQDIAAMMADVSPLMAWIESRPIRPTSRKTVWADEYALAVQQLSESSSRRNGSNQITLGDTRCPASAPSIRYTRSP